MRALLPSINILPSFRASRAFCSPCTFSVYCFAVSRLLSTLDENLENGSQRASNLSAHHDKLHGWPRYIYFYRQPLPSILLDIFVLLLSSFLFLDTFNTVPEIVCIFKLMIRVQLFKQKRKMLSRSN